MKGAATPPGAAEPGDQTTVGAPPPTAPPSPATQEAEGPSEHTAIDAPPFPPATPAPPIKFPLEIRTETPLPGLLRFGAHPSDDDNAATAVGRAPSAASAREPPPPARPSPTVCPACGAASTDSSWCDRCGTELSPAQTLPGSDPPAAEPIGSGAPHAPREGDLLRGEALSALLANAQPPERALEIATTVARALGLLHTRGLAALGLYPEHTFVDGESVRFANEVPFARLDDVSALRAPVRGFSPPEVFGRGEGRICAASDVFVAAMLLYYLLTGAPRIDELAESGVVLPDLRDWRPSLPPGLLGLVRRATHRLASKRTRDVDAFLADLATARDDLERRAHADYAPLRHHIAVDGHIGVAKLKQRPVNEDSSFAGGDEERHKSLCIVADGVTHASLGTGNLASALVAGAARDRWPRLLESRIAVGEIPPRVAENLLGTLLRSANLAIVARANELTVEPPPPATEVMASTAVMALLDGNRLHLVNLGDSRAYLFARGELERLTADHDVRHELLRERRPLAEVEAAAGGSQLTRFVGRLERREQSWSALDPLPDHFHLTVCPGDRLLLCSDGLSDYVGATDIEGDAAITRVLAQHRDPARAAFELVVLANRGGGGDNISVILVDIES